MDSGVLQRDGAASVNSAEGCMATASRLAFFTTIPPERVGLNGEYDHHGLAKRVTLAFRQQYSADDLRLLRIKQRGAVVVLVGKVPTQALLNRLVQTAMSTLGAVEVETYGISILELQGYAHSPFTLSPGFYVYG